MARWACGLMGLGLSVAKSLLLLCSHTEISGRRRQRLTDLVLST